ncbi:hypothetical protein WMY93_005901 [Mugilogobius chulae]|uniref:Uncharacterized protein n=1 Tax=Mugilogobius chulae TaxID=88201 RepID=A0AAW0PMI1_9GOBI
MTSFYINSIQPGESHCTCAQQPPLPPRCEKPTRASRTGAAAVTAAAVALALFPSRSTKDPGRTTGLPACSSSCSGSLSPSRSRPPRFTHRERVTDVRDYFITTTPPIVYRPESSRMSVGSDFGNPLRKFKLVFLGEQSEIRNDSELKQQQEIWTNEKFKLAEEWSKKHAEIAKLQAKIEEIENALVTEQQKNRDDIISELNKLKLKERLLEKLDKLKTKNAQLKEMLAMEQQNSRKIMDDELKHQKEMFAKERSQIENNLSQLKDQIEKIREANELERQDWISKEKNWKEIEKLEKRVLEVISTKKQQEENNQKCITKPKMEVQTVVAKKAPVPQSTMYSQLSDSESSSDDSTSQTESIPRLPENGLLKRRRSLSSQDTLHKIGHPSQIKKKKNQNTPPTNQAQRVTKRKRTQRKMKNGMTYL